MTVAKIRENKMKTFAAALLILSMIVIPLTLTMGSCSDEGPIIDTKCALLDHCDTDVDCQAILQQRDSTEFDPEGFKCVAIEEVGGCESCPTGVECPTGVCLRQPQ